MKKNICTEEKALVLFGFFKLSSSFYCLRPVSLHFFNYVDKLVAKLIFLLKGIWGLLLIFELVDCLFLF